MERGSKRGAQATLSELIAAAGEVAFEYCDNDRDAHRMARLALIELIKSTSQTINFDKQFYLSTDTSQPVH